MQEIALLLSSVAGVVTAAAVRRIPKSKPQLLSLGASSHIKSQINSLKIEKDLLAKTISRLYQDDTYSKIHRDKLLLKYQHQMGMVLAKLEKLEQASKHPDLGPVGDGLITLMDQKLSTLDDRLYELSSKMALATQPKREQDSKKQEVKKSEAEEAVKTPVGTAFDFKELNTSMAAKKRQSFELVTLTKTSGKKPQFQQFEKQEESKEPVQSTPQAITPSVQKKPKDKIKTVQAPAAIQEKAKPETQNVLNKHKALPEPKITTGATPPEDDMDDDIDDIDAIKRSINKAMSRLAQAEVE